MDASIGDDTTVGPFAYIRPKADIRNHVKIGDFVEIKNSVIDDGTKVSHLTYIGDSDVGKNINFGCRTITVNYDGKNKFRTVIEDNAFIGCNTNLVAPVTVKNGAFIAAGSTITDDVDENSLAIARCRQTVKKDWKRK
jgi:bifunctional UDP-N-acetylglucosamine pyrophosphorylase/glucosamine-1-phosphate N-acetyltransferase